MKLFILITSFLLDGIVSNYLPLNGIWNQLFTITSLIIVYPYFNGNKREYYKYSFILGIFYDLIYTDTIIFNAFMFLLMARIIVKLASVLSDTYINLLIITLMLIIVYRSVTYILMVITGNLIFDYHSLFKGIYNSILVNIIFVITMTLITNFISKKFKIKKSSY